MEKEQFIDLSTQHANPITKPFIAQEITKVENKLNAKISATDKKLAHEVTNFNKEKTAFDNKLEKMIGNLDNKVTEEATQLGNQVTTLKEETTTAKNQLGTRITELDNKVTEEIIQFDIVDNIICLNKFCIALPNTVTTEHNKSLVTKASETCNNASVNFRKLINTIIDIG